MLSESYPPTSLPAYQEPRALARDQSLAELSRAFARLATRRGAWAAFAFAVLTAWASWRVASWLLERWQFH